jgi:hypothetical protein
VKRLALSILAGLVLLALGGLAGWRLHRPGADARAYAEMRLIAVQVSLDEAPPDYVFWAGDSQVELQPGDQRPCDLDLKPTEQFEAAAEAIIRRLQSLSPRVVVTALPPVGREIGKLVEAGAVADYSRRLQALCGRLGCIFADPFAALRDGDTGYAKPGALRDGLHLAAFRPALKALEPALCAP